MTARPTPPSAAGSYAVVATVNETNYTGSAAGTLVIAGDALASWRAGHFTPEEIAAGLAADGADADGDGFINHAEYTLGTDPRAFTPQPLRPHARRRQPIHPELRRPQRGRRGLRRPDAEI